MKDKIRVLVADDSAFARLSIAKALRLDAAMEVVGQARDGIQAVEMVKGLKPDVVTLDVTMPRMDGIAALRQIMSENPTPVVMVSALTGPQTKATIEALEIGAVDFFLKQGSADKASSNRVSADLIRKVRLAADAKVSGLKGPLTPKVSPPARRASGQIPSGRIDKVVVIGTSTGGPRALAGLIPWIPADLPAAFLIVQHMPSGFTKSLAERLDQASPMKVREAEVGDTLRPGQALVAPGNFHMTVARHGVVALNQDPPPNRKHRILATDVDRRILAKAKNGGPYTRADVANVKPGLLVKHFEMSNGSYTVNENLRSKVEFKVQNMLEDKFEGGFDLVVCRNVVIYFTDEAKAVLNTKLIGAIKSNGVLFIGATETLLDSKGLGLARLYPAFYQKSQAAASPRKGERLAIPTS